MNAVVWISKEASRLQRAHPKMTWKQAKAKARSNYYTNKKKPARKKVGKARPARKKSVRRKRVGAVKKKTTTQKKVEVSVGTVSSHMGAAKKMLLDDIGKKDSQIFAATKKIVKRKLQKQLAKLKQQYRKLAC